VTEAKTREWLRGKASVTEVQPPAPGQAASGAASGGDAT
jgi:hypothetical protein